MVIDKKTGRPVGNGDTLIRRDYKGFKHRYEILELIEPSMVRVRKLASNDQWIYLCMPMATLQLDNVLL
jgi:hypothetical protein